MPDGAEVEAEVIGAAVEAEAAAAVVEAALGRVRVTPADKQSVWVTPRISVITVSIGDGVPPPQGARTLEVGRTTIPLHHWQK